ncbi:Acyl-coenzyme A thioesterase 11 [Mortierella sp. AM989]|nr:Acyl-coenzyme A thioesterase 11 [Mortierella sp. AM989]
MDEGIVSEVTRSVDAVHFLGPITTQNIVIIQASVNRAWKTSMEVGVRVMTEDLLSADQRYVCHAYLTFVALPQAPLQTLKPGPPQRVPSHRDVHHQQQQHVPQDAAISDSPAARRYSFSLPSAKSKSSGGSILQSIQLPAIEPVTRVEMERYTMAQSRREARLKQAREESKADDDKLLSDVRDQMRRWNVGQFKNPRLKLPPSEIDGTPNIAMQATFAESAQLVLPQHANSLSITFGGQVMKWMENVAAVSASRFSRVPIVTASIDSLQFHRKTMIGDCLTMRSVVTRVFKSSMEVYVFVDSENLVTGKQTFTNEAFFSMVAIQPSSPSLLITPAPHEQHRQEEQEQEQQHQRQPRNFIPLLTKSRLPHLVPGSGMEKALSDAAEDRRIKRLEQRQELAEREMQHLAQTPAVEKLNDFEHQHQQQQPQQHTVQIASPATTNL